MDNVSLVINATVNQTALPLPIQQGIDVLYPRIRDLILAPGEHPEMLWTLAPMIIALFLMQMYFGRNKEESLGWNTAFGNAVALIFISASLFRQLFIMSGFSNIWDYVYSQDAKMLIVVVLLGYGVFLSLLSFFHWLPERIAFFIMNGLSINTTAYVAIVLVNSSNIPLDEHTLFAGAIIFVLVYVVSVIFRSAIPQSKAARKKKLETLRHIVDLQAEEVDRRMKATNFNFIRKRLLEKEEKLKAKSARLKDMIALIG